MVYKSVYFVESVFVVTFILRIEDFKSIDFLNVYWRAF